MKNLLFTLSIFSSLIVNAQSINLVEFATGLTSPVEITNANDNRLFVVQQNGIIKIIQPDGTINPTNFLNISSKILFNGERGLLGLAFHPQYSTNGYFLCIIIIRPVMLYWQDIVSIPPILMWQIPILKKYY